MLELQTMVKSISIGIQFSWGSGGAVNSLFPVSSEWLPGTASKDEAPESSYSFICKSTYFNTVFFLGGAPASICHFFVCPSICLFVRPSICRALYFRNRASCDHYFWYTCVKWWHIQAFFSFFFFLILIFWVVKGVKGQKIAQNKK